MNAAEEELALHWQLGLAITNWADVERGIVQILFSTTRDPVAIAVGFLGIENFRSKLKFADSIVELKLKKKPALLSAWRDLRERIERASWRRNKIAHCILWSDIAKKAGKRYSLADWLSPRVKNVRQKVEGRPLKGALYLKDVSDIKIEFSVLAVDLSTFLVLLLADQQKVQPPAVVAPPKRRTTIHTISAQIREALELPQKPSRKRPSGKQDG